MKDLSGMIQISPRKMQFQWLAVPFKFHLRMWNFEVQLGKAAQEIFQESFNLQRFNAPGSPAWRHRVNNKDPFRPILEETLSLRKSIKWKRTKDNNGHTVKIYTDPNGFANTKRHQGFCYAAVHNAPNHSKDGIKYRRGRVRNMPQRQFMGHTPVLKKKMEELEATIFKGLV